MRRYIPYVCCFVLFCGCIYGIVIRVKAEQVGSSPTNASTSKITAVYNSVVGLNYGSVAAGSWGDWGAMWNRIRSAGEWTPGGTLTVGEVSPGKTFYAGANSRTQQTGTGTIYSTQQYSTRDDYGGPNGSGVEDYQGEESAWTSSVTNVWKDGRTGVYWTNDKGSMTNSFTAMSLNTCDFFNTTPRSDYAGGDADCGVAINYCAALDFGGRTNWYLPSQKELMQAYIDGMYNQAGTTLANAAAFTTTNYFWSSSENSNDSTNAWYVYLSYGYPYYHAKSNGANVRCASRD